MLRVAIDATPMLKEVGRTGIGVLTAEIVERAAQRHKVVVYAKTGRAPGDLSRTRLPAGVRRVPSWKMMPAGALGSIWCHLSWPRAEAWTGRVDVVHGTNSIVPPTKRAGRIVTVHDLAPIHFKDTVGDQHLKDPDLIRRAVASGALVHTFSEFVKEEVIELLKAPRNRVVAIAPGPPVLAAGTLKEGRRLAESDRYILALGTLQPRKNLPTLIKAFTLIAERHRDVRLLLVGAMSPNGDDVTAAIEQANLGPQINCDFGWVDEPQKAALLRGATVFAYPSRYEGFGLPLLEAMEAGVPVVTTIEGALPEVAGEAAIFVDPDDIEELADALEKLLRDDSARRTLVEAGRRNLERFSWATFETKLTDLYERAARNGNSPDPDL